MHIEHKDGLILTGGGARAAWRRLIVALGLLVMQPAHSHECSGVDRTLSDKQKDLLAPIAEAQLKRQLDPKVASLVVVRRADVLGSFRVRNWFIVHVADNATDDLYLFYSRNPLKAKGYISAWGGAASADESGEVRAWAEREAPGIPRELSGCFAWYVAKGIAE